MTKSKLIFKNFKQELTEHSVSGYHQLKKYEQNVGDILHKHKIDVCEEYLMFLNDVGYGSFFNGSLVLFPIENAEGSVLAVTNKLKEWDITDLIAVGYNGTTEGFYCLSKNPLDKMVYWVDSFDGKVTKEDDGFYNWIESSTDRFFNPQIFAGFKTIKDINSVQRIINERSKFKFELINYDLKLVRPPHRPEDVLPRFNKLILRVTQLAESDLEVLTLKFKRIGSNIGDANVEYLTIDVPEIYPKETCELEAYLFDPYNLPFKRIECDFNPGIDLSSKMRVRYKELASYL